MEELKEKDLSKSILKKYTNPAHPGAFQSISGFLKNNKNIKKNEAEKVLSGLDAYTLHKPVRRKFPRNKFIVKGIDDMWQCDLVDVANLASRRNSQNFTYLFVCIDVFSKFAWVIPCKNKSAQECKNALAKIFSGTPRRPARIYSDDGKEFKEVFSKYLVNNNIQQLITNSDLASKAAIVERFNRTLKSKLWRVFSHRANTKYSDVLQKVVNSYNNSFHRTIQTTPNAVNKSNEQEIYNLMYHDALFHNDDFMKQEKYSFKFNIGDYVRISLKKELFEKGYTPNWSSDVYIIRDQIPSQKPKYIVAKYIASEKKLVNLKRSKYEEQLQHVTFKEFPYDTFRVLNKSKNKLLVQRLNEKNQQEPLWVDEATFEEEEEAETTEQVHTEQVHTEDKGPSVSDIQHPPESEQPVVAKRTRGRPKKTQTPPRSPAAAAAARQQPRRVLRRRQANSFGIKKK